MTSASQTVDPEEIERFSRIADEWWDEKGKFRPLHVLGPTRLGYVRDRACVHFTRDSKQLRALAGLTILDIGCGGGLMCEPMVRLGAAVTGIDASERNIQVAALHARKMNLEVDYRCASPEELMIGVPRSVVSESNITNHKPRAAHRLFDIVLALEIVEHVADVPEFLKACTALVKPGGLLIMSTLNRSFKSYALAIIGAEYILRWLPRGTHQWKKFLKPSELCAGIRHEGLRVSDMAGMVFNPLRNAWSLSKTDLDVNYLVTASKPA